MSFTGYVALGFGDTNNADVDYYVEFDGTADVFTLVPYKQILFFTRLTEASGGLHAWVGGAYNFEIGSAYISYCESAYTFDSDIWSQSY